MTRPGNLNSNVLTLGVREIIPPRLNLSESITAGQELAVCVLHEDANGLEAFDRLGCPDVGQDFLEAGTKLLARLHGCFTHGTDDASGLIEV